MISFSDTSKHTVYIQRCDKVATKVPPESPPPPLHDQQQVKITTHWLVGCHGNCLVFASVFIYELQYLLLCFTLDQINLPPQTDRWRSCPNI